VDYKLIIKIALITAAILLATPVDYRLIIKVAIITTAVLLAVQMLTH
jgi:hypothetical protein